MKEICETNCLHIDYTFYNHNNNINKTMNEICETNCLHVDSTFCTHNNKINKTMKEICKTNCLHIDYTFYNHNKINRLCIYICLLCTLPLTQNRNF